MNKRLVSVSKFLSLVLRHQPGVVGMQLDDEGWLSIDKLIANANERGNDITLDLLHEVVATNDKKRFALSDDGLRIRANQGHSVANVELNLQPTKPPELLYHGTVAVFMDSIRQSGLHKRSRNHVHLSADHLTAVKVAQRRGTPIILTVEAAKMNEAGHKFFLSANGVWLTNAVPKTFIRL
jgi:putative RNA 2'-phosphotransferase